MKEDPYTGYYTYDFSGESFTGDVIILDPDSLNVLFQNYSDGDEYRFREKLEKMDEWLKDKPYKVYSNWVKHVITWLERDKESKKDRW